MVARFFLVPLTILLAAPAAIGEPAVLRSEGGAWPLYRQWTPAETAHYARWIENMFEVKWRGTNAQRLAKIEEVLTDPETNLLLDPGFVGSPSNPQLDRTIMLAMHEVLDCAKLVTALPAYYAYRRGLPWMGTRIRSGDGTDIRRASFNIPESTFSCRDFDSPAAFFAMALGTVCTGNYRINPVLPSSALSDTVPVAINPQYLIPGALYYMDGHISILAKVTGTGTLRFLDATVSPTRDIYTHNGMNAVIGLSPRAEGDHACKGCYRGFRIYRYPIAEVNASGLVTTVRRRTDREMQAFGFSMEQYDLLAELLRTRAIQTSAGPVKGLHDLIRHRMRAGRRVAPLAMLEETAAAMTALLEARAVHVQSAWEAVRKGRPIVFPAGNAEANVYSAGGQWGKLSSALGDAEIREIYFDLVVEIAEAVKLLGVNPDVVQIPKGVEITAMSEAGFARWMIAEKSRVFARHQFTWRDSAGSLIVEDLNAIESRIFDLSFDPNHPPELRWGLPPARVPNALQGKCGTPVPGRGVVPMARAYALQAFYRTRTYRDVEPSRLQEEPPTGHYRRDRLEPYLRARWELTD